jgi:hypothetical protein
MYSVLHIYIYTCVCGYVDVDMDMDIDVDWVRFQRNMYDFPCMHTIVWF